jgi:hypothetical protein
MQIRGFLDFSGVAVPLYERKSTSEEFVSLLKKMSEPLKLVIQMNKRCQIR